MVGDKNHIPEVIRFCQKSRIVHVHAKDAHMDGQHARWGPLGTRRVVEGTNPGAS